MSNKTQLQTNNTALASLTDRVLAAKDTAAALPDAGGGGSFEKLSVTVTDNGMFEPGANEYILDIPGLNFSTRNLVILCAKCKMAEGNLIHKSVLCVFDSSVEANGMENKMWVGDFMSAGLTTNIETQENSFYVYGDFSAYLYIEFVVYAC